LVTAAAAAGGGGGVGDLSAASACAGASWEGRAFVGPTDRQQGGDPSMDTLLVCIDNAIHYKISRNASIRKQAESTV
jgi:hypothetical protein